MSARPLRPVLIVLAALAAAGLAPARLYAQQQQLGRLFFTPQQREEMDRRRASNAPAASVTAVDLVTINGQVSRSSGKSTTWINGTPQDDIHAGGDTSRITIQGTGDAPSASMKVGETLDRLKGEKRDALEGGKIVVRHR